MKNRALRMEMRRGTNVRIRKRRDAKRKKKAAVILALGASLCMGSYVYMRQIRAAEETKIYKTEDVMVGVSEIYGEGVFSESEDLHDTGNRKDILKGINSPNAILLDVQRGQVLAEKDAAERIYPASMTKIMTAVLALERIENLDEYVVLSNEDFQNLYEQEASMAGFQPGEEVTYRDLLYGIILPSGAECCLAVANRIAGSEEAFAELMNEKAQTLGMKHTHFTNCTGLEGVEHVSTVEDIAVLLKYAIQNQQFYEIFTCGFYSVAPTNLHPEGFTFYSTVTENLDSMQVNGGILLGGKTGYTEDAGLCLASMAQIYEKEYILVTAGADGKPGYRAAHLMDAVSVYDRIG